MAESKGRDSRTQIDRLDDRKARLEELVASDNRAGTPLHQLALQARVEVLKKSIASKLWLHSSLITRPHEEMPWCGDDDQQKWPPLICHLSTPRGVAVQLYLVALYIEQHRPRREHGRATPVPLSEAQRDVKHPWTWTDLIAVPTQHTSDKRPHGKKRPDKRLRSVKAALDRLEGAGAVALGPANARDRYGGFRLLGEGVNNHVTEVSYKMPERESAFCVPAEFITNGWVHVLSDGEIRLFLALNYRFQKTGAESIQLFPDDREAYFAIGKDTYEYHRRLAAFGLVDTHEDPRRRYDHIQSYESDGPGDVHTLKLAPGGLEQDALEAVRNGLDELLDYYADVGDARRRGEIWKEMKGANTSG